MGEEASASERGGQFTTGLSAALDHPLGLGLGTASNRSSSQVSSTEIYWWQTAIEISIAGLIADWLLYASILKRLWSRRHHRSISIVAWSLGVSYLVEGFGSIIVGEPTFTVLVWILFGFGLNSTPEGNFGA